jgi:hypothetical protein
MSIFTDYAILIITVIVSAIVWHLTTLHLEKNQELTVTMEMYAPRVILFFAFVPLISNEITRRFVKGALRVNDPSYTVPIALAAVVGGIIHKYVVKHEILESPLYYNMLALCVVGCNIGSLVGNIILQNITR